METRMAPSYTNLFMAKLEEDLIFTNWDYGQESLKLFLQQINLFHTTIKFTAETFTKRITFLDTTLMLENDILHTQPVY